MLLSRERKHLKKYRENITLQSRFLWCKNALSKRQCYFRQEVVSWDEAESFATCSKHISPPREARHGYLGPSPGETLRHT